VPGSTAEPRPTAEPGPTAEPRPTTAQARTAARPVNGGAGPTATVWPAARPPGPPTRAESRRAAAAQAKARRGWIRRPGRSDWTRPAAAHDAARSRWNALAIAAVVSILTWTPLPLVLRLLAVRQTRRYGQRGERLAYIGIAVGAVLLVVYGYALAVSWS
jgi:hypothetical protein